MKVCGRQFTVNHHKMSKKKRSMSYFAPDVVVIVVAILFGMPVGDVSRMHV